MEDALRRFLTFKDSVLLWPAGKKPKPKANALKKELVKKRKVDEELNAATWTPSELCRERNAWWNYISHEIDVSKELDANFNFLKIHLTTRWVEQICRNWALQQYSAERQEQAHQTNLKDSWNATNHNLNYLPQVITIRRCILCFEVRELNQQALANPRENSAAAWQVRSSGSDVAAP